MTEQMRPRVKYVIGPDGSPLTIADLPPEGTQRWVIRRKAEAVAAVRGGLLSLADFSLPTSRGGRSGRIGRSFVLRRLLSTPGKKCRE